MKKKQLLFLFAAAALFAACSSDELTDNNQNGGDDSTVTLADDIPSSVAVSTEGGLGMTVGASSATTKAAADGDTDYFTLTLPDDIFDNWEGYVAEADDFYIIKTVNSNKEVIEVVKDGSTEAYSGKLKVTHDEDLVVTVDGINATDSYATGVPVEYTFEVYIWITNQIGKTYSGADGVYEITTENFSYTQKLEWIGLNADAIVTKETERGMDFTQEVADNGRAVLTKNVTAKYGDNKDQKYHYNIRYNVYRGLQGNPTTADGTVNEETGLGNTPYIKVSIHTCRIENPADPDGEEVFPVLPKD